MSSRAWKGGSTRRWRRIRSVALQRDGYRCRFADVIAGTYLPHLRPWAGTLRVSPQCTGSDMTRLHVHHVRGKADGDDPHWLLTGCGACNLATGSPQQYEPELGGVSKW